MKKPRLILYFSFIFILALARPVFGEVIVSEIMYDLPGSDSGREWVEIKNTGTQSISVDFKKWKLVESDNSHNVSFFRGNQVLPPQGFAVIASDPNKFLQDWPSYQGSILRSSFSLNNSSGKILIKLGTTTSTTLVNYDSNLGATGDGNSLQLFDSGWKASIPTPGNINVLVQNVPAVSIVNEEKSVSKKADNLVPKALPKSELLKTDQKPDKNVEVVKEGFPLKNTENPSDLWSWLLALGGIIIVGVMVILLPNNKNGVENKGRSLADEYTIIE